MKIAMEIGDWGGEGRAYGNLGNCYQSLSDYRKSIEYDVKHLKIPMKSVIGVEKEEPMEILVLLTNENPLSTMRKA